MGVFGPILQMDQARRAQQQSLAAQQAQIAAQQQAEQAAAAERERFETEKQLQQQAFDLQKQQGQQTFQASEAQKAQAAAQSNIKLTDQLRQHAADLARIRSIAFRNRLAQKPKDAGPEYIEQAGADTGVDSSEIDAALKTYQAGRAGNPFDASILDPKVWKDRRWVDKNTGAPLTDYKMTGGEALAAGNLLFDPTSYKAYQDNVAATHSLGVLWKYSYVLPLEPGVDAATFAKWNRYMHSWEGQNDVAAFNTATSGLIPYLRALAKTGRVNIRELGVAISGFQTPSRSGLAGALSAAQDVLAAERNGLQMAGRPISADVYGSWIFGGAPAAAPTTTAPAPPPTGAPAAAAAPRMATPAAPPSAIAPSAPSAATSTATAPALPPVLESKKYGTLKFNGKVHPNGAEYVDAKGKIYLMPVR